VDLKVNKSIKYYIIAPGVGLISTLPGHQYAAWSGTSMSAPIVSGIAALVRTKFPDKTNFSSRFIMGQIASTGPMLQGFKNSFGFPVLFRTPDALAALVTVPKPNILYSHCILFDTLRQSSSNTPNGRVDAGETIDLALVIRNQWGRADNVSVKLEAVAGVVGPDPYVTMVTDTVDYGAVGSFNTDDNGLTFDAAGTVLGVAHPFKFTASPATPNGHIIPFKVTVMARNGFDPGDNTIYSTESFFNLVVTNGKELPRIISSDMVLTKDTLWFVPDATLIESGVVVTVTEGTNIQFYSSVPYSPYSQEPNPKIIVKGKLILIGTVNEPVRFYLNPVYAGRDVRVSKSNLGEIQINYSIIENPCIIVDNIDHAKFIGTGVIDTLYGGGINKYVEAKNISNSRFESLDPHEYVEYYWGGLHPFGFTLNSSTYSAVSVSITGTLF